MACELLAKETLTYDEKLYVMENWQEGAEHNNGSMGAFFTPINLANDFKLHISGNKIIDICAGIGALSFMYYHGFYHDQEPDITCVEINPAYVEIGKKLLPEANWICADISEIWKELGRFDCAISNPPFGKKVKINSCLNYKGLEAEYRVIEIASKLAKWGAFIVPQSSAPFAYSGRQCFKEHESNKYKKFFAETAIDFEMNVGVDTQIYINDWHGVMPMCEIVCCDFVECAKEEKIEVFAPKVAHREQLTLDLLAA